MTADELKAQATRKAQADARDRDIVAESQKRDAILQMMWFPSAATTAGAHRGARRAQKEYKVLDRADESRSALTPQATARSKQFGDKN
jgi:hypothetical protein